MVEVVEAAATVEAVEEALVAVEEALAALEVEALVEVV